MKRIQKIMSGTGILASCLVAPFAVGSTNLTTLVSFDGSNGGQPWAGLVLGKDGSFYGTTDQSGTHSAGTVFRMTLDGHLTTLHSFTGGNDGAHPKAGLLQGADGNFYGTTTDGGNGQGSFYEGDGVIFKITPAGDFTTLASFSGTNGSKPWAAPLVAGPDDFFYGTTAFGGPTVPSYSWGYGTVFRMATDGMLTTMHSFDYDLGDTPYGGLVEGADGNFYGTTYSGGPNSGGTVFNMTQDGSLTPLVSFSYYATNGFGPFSALLQGNDGNFYGTTIQGGVSYGDPDTVNRGGFGTIFKMTPEGTLTTLISFSGTNGAYPYATLVQDDKGYFYGTTASGGAHTNELFPGVIGYAGYGTVFRFAPNEGLTTLVSFDSTNGAQPFAGVTRGPDGKLYGTTIRGGAHELGTVYRLSIPGAPSSPPTISCSDAATIDCGTAAEVNVLVNDPDGDALTVVWTVNGSPLQTNTVPASQPAAATEVSLLADLPLGTNHVVVSVTDTAANTAFCSTVITVVDSTRPKIVFATARPNFLWPPNHQMVAVTVKATVKDACSATRWRITRVQSNEPANGRGDGHAEPDWVITGDHAVRLRAERSGKGEGRTYSITIRAIDAWGNLSKPDIVHVSVPKSLGKVEKTPSVEHSRENKETWSKPSSIKP